MSETAWLRKTYDDDIWSDSLTVGHVFCARTYSNWHTHAHLKWKFAVKALPLYAASVATTSSAVVVAILIINKNIDNVVVFITKQQITFKKHTYFVWVYVCTQQKLQQLLSLSRKQSKRLRNTNFCMLKIFLEIQAASMQTKIKTKREESTNFGSTFNFFVALFSYRHVCLVNSDKEIFFYYFRFINLYICLTTERDAFWW